MNIRTKIVCAVVGVAVLAAIPAFVVANLSGGSFGIVLGGLFLAIIVATLVAFVLATSITRPLEELAQQIGQVANGNLSAASMVASADEIGAVVAGFATMQANLRKTINQINQSAGQIASASTQLGTSAATIARNANTAAEQSSGAAASTEQMAATAGSIAENCDVATQAANAATEAANTSAYVSMESINSINAIAERVKASSECIGRLGERSDQIGAIVSTIKDIAAQTNLLALNAAIEAARAGESGRGFAVVADEVRKLAERTTLATGDIDKMITAIQDKTGGIASSMNDMLPQVERGTASAQLAAQSLEQISEASEQILHRTRDSVSASHEQRQASNAIAQRVEQIAQMVEETSAAMRNASESAGHTGQLAVDLKSMVERFRI